MEGDGKEADKRRNTRFKLIPQVVKGSWIVRQSVGTTPVLLGQKLLTRYFRCAAAGEGLWAVMVHHVSVVLCGA